MGGKNARKGILLDNVHAIPTFYRIITRGISLQKGILIYILDKKENAAESPLLHPRTKNALKRRKIIGCKLSV